MGGKKIWCLLGGLVLLAAAGPAGAAVTLLHEFAGWPDDGSSPYGSLTLDGSTGTLYGMASAGGADDYGVVFRVGTDGSGFALLHEFTGDGSEGVEPYGSLTLDGSTGTLYGMANWGGADNGGVLFKMNTNGSGFALLHEFAGGVDDGGSPLGSLTLSGTTLYGMTNEGGDSDAGVVFKVDTDGTDFTLLHEFAGFPTDGGDPYGSLTLDGTTLYGMTRYGGETFDAGVVFKVDTDGTDFTLLHEFEGDDGGHPQGDLTLSGSTLYGMTKDGGDSIAGVVFSMNTDGSGFSLLHEFADDANDGGHPEGSLTLSGSTLYGMTKSGGDSDAGVVFSLNTDGTGFTLWHEFADSVDDGGYPEGSLTLDGLTLYGMTAEGGDDDYGVVFKHELGGGTPIPEAPTGLLFGLGLAALLPILGRRRREAG